MAYKFEPAINPYVDPGSVKVSEILNQRFAENFAVNDALNTALRDMQFAPFENDSMLAKNARDYADNKLQEFAERGDYENMTFPLHALAKETGNKLKPLADNYARYSNTLNDLSERLKKGEINPEQYQLYKPFMVSGYKGIELDDTGRVKSGSEFMPPTLYNDPKVMDRITKRLEILHTQKTGRETSGIQRDPTTGDLLVIEQGGTMSKIDYSDVQKVVNAVMEEPDVKMYYDQMGTMKVRGISDAAGGPDKLVSAQVANIQNKIGELNTELNSGKYGAREKNQITQAINSLNKELTNISNFKTPEEMLAYTKQAIIEDYQKPIREYANLKGGIYEQTSKYKVDNISARARETEAIKWHMEHPELAELGEVNATQWGGKDVNEKMQRIKDSQTQIQKLQEIVNTGQKDGVELEQSEIIKVSKEIKALEQDRLNLESQIKEAARKALTYDELRKQDPTLIDALAEHLKTTDPGEIYLRMQQIFDNSDDQDYLDFEQHFNESSNVSSGKYALQTHINKFYGTGINMSNFENERQKSNIPSFGQGQTDNFYTTKILDETGLGVNETFINAFQNKVDKGLLEVKTTPVWSVNRIPGLTADDTRRFTNAFDNIFLNKPLQASTVYTDAAGTQVTDLNNATITSYKPPLTGTSLMKLEIVQGTDKTPKTVYMDINQITSPEIQQIYNSNSFRLASRMVENGNVGKFDIKLNTVNPETGEFAQPLTLRFTDIRENGKPLVTILQNNGEPMTKEWFQNNGFGYSITKAIDPNSAMFKDFIEKPFFEVN